MQSKIFERRLRIVISLGFKSYSDYLRSPLWSAIRKRVFKAKGRSCFLCGAFATQVHHQRYREDDLNGNSIRKLFPICGECHKGIERDPDGAKTVNWRVRQKFNAARRLLCRAEENEQRFARILADFDELDRTEAIL